MRELFHGTGRTASSIIASHHRSIAHPLLPTALAAAMLSAAMLAGFATRLAAQTTYVSVGNRYVSATAITNNDSPEGAGRFVIKSGAASGDYLFLYRTTSYVVFRVALPDTTFFLTNAKPMFGGGPIVDPTTPVAYLPTDSVFTSGDTLTFLWRDVVGFAITMRLFAERTTTVFDRGSDIVVEFQCIREAAPPSAQLGIFMMLDLYNGNAEGTSGAGDKVSVLASNGYLPNTRQGRTFIEPTTPAPDFYQVGNFRWQAPPSPQNTVLPVHRLRGTTHGGLALTAPKALAFANWRALRNLSWIDGDVEQGTLKLEDAASAMQWIAQGDSAIVRTAFGTSDNEGNNLFTCRDTGLFVAIHADRLVERASKGAPFEPNVLDVVTYVTNTADAATSMKMVLMEPIAAVDGNARLMLDTGESTQSLQFAPHETRALHWRLGIVATDTTLVDAPLDFRFEVADDGITRIFKLPCSPRIAFNGTGQLMGVDDDARTDARAGSALAIVEISPQPLLAAASSTLHVRLRGLEHDGAGALIAPDGRVVASWPLDAGTTDGVLPLPADLPSGVYVLRIHQGRTMAVRRVTLLR